MSEYCHMISKGRRAMALLVLLGIAGTRAVHAGADAAAANGPITKGLRILSAGHSFHVFVPTILRDLAQLAEIPDHMQVDVQSLGGSRVIQHWDLPDEKNKAKRALRTGQVDVLTLSPIYLPDEGIERFTELALEHNPNIRILIQAFWLPFDVYAPDYKQKKPAPVDRNMRTGEDLRRMHAEYFRSLDEAAGELNRRHGRPVLAIVPAGQAVIALRERIQAGEAPGLATQDDLFTDAIGHARPPLAALVAYCHYAVIYRRSPVGLPMPAVLAKAGNLERGADLNLLLQKLAWQAALEHPHSGVASRP